MKKQILLGTGVLSLILVFIYEIIFFHLIESIVPKFQVDEVTLSDFTLSPTNNMTLNYNLAVNMTFINPSNQAGIQYDTIEASAMYHGNRLMTKQVPGFFQGHKKNNNVSAVFKGERLLVLYNNGTDEKVLYESESKDGVYNINLILMFDMRYNAMLQKTSKFKSKALCYLKVPLSSSQGKLGSVDKTKCSYKKGF